MLAHFMTLPAVKGVSKEGLVYAPFHAFFAGTIVSVQTVLLFHFVRELNFHTRHQAAYAAAAPFLRYQHIIDTEVSQPGYVGDMPVRPITDELLLIKIVGGGNNGTGMPFPRTFSRTPEV